MSRSWLLGASLAALVAVHASSISTTSLSTKAASAMASTTPALEILTPTPTTTPTTALTTILAATSTTASTTATDDNTVVEFTEDTFYDYQPGNSSVYVGGSPKTFAFTVASSFSSFAVTDVQLREQTDGNVVASLTQKDTGPASASLTCTLNAAASGTPYSGTVTISDTKALVDKYNGVGLYFEILWTVDGAAGISYSRSFAFVSDNAQLSSLAASFTQTSPVLSESLPSGLTATKTAAGTMSILTAAGTATTSGTAAATGQAMSTASSSGSSGISKGAIAGIVVGVVAAVAIAGALGFYFLRRRNAKTDRRAYNAALLSSSVEPYRGARPAEDLGGPHPNLHDGTGSGTAVNLMEKDAVAGAAGAAAGRFADRRDAGPNSPHSPPSPYSDDDGSSPQIIPARPADTPSAAASAAASPIARSVHAVSPVASPAQPVPAAAPVSGQVAALIEDDMTPEEIARLEAEERELDAAIENAVRSRGAAAGRLS